MKLKICGLKYSDNIRQVAQLDPDYLGFIFHRGSKRFVGDDFVMPEIPVGIKRCGVFADTSVEQILIAVEKHKLDLVQLHGNESPGFCKEVSALIPVIKAFGADDNFNVNAITPYEPYCSYFLFDNYSDVYGGAAKPFNWNVLLNYKGNIPFFVGGGMDLPAYRKLLDLGIKVYGIDVSNKIEIKPGYKDIIKVIRIKNNISSSGI
ncbi:MAG TPA: phosphoribosylanthranilate isomerase [Bacteroidia bacterium]|jgi:phosphoribosylanthranilate isomerase